MISYEEFVNELKTRLMDRLELPEEKVYFCRKGETFAKDGDRLMIECMESEEERGGVGIYVRELYEKDPQMKAIPSAVDDIEEEVSRVRKADFLKNTHKLRSFNEIKDQIFLRAINYDRNEEELKDAIYKKIGDIALTAYFKIGELNRGIISTKLRKFQVEKWNKSEEEVFQWAMNNMEKTTEPRIYCWQKMIFGLQTEGEEFMGSTDSTVINKGPLGNCISTRERTNGATVLFLPGVAERLSELLDGDFYAVFTSIHEVMIHSVETADVDDLKAVLMHTLSEATMERDVLTEYVYRYDRGKRKLSIC